VERKWGLFSVWRVVVCGGGGRACARNILVIFRVKTRLNPSGILAHRGGGGVDTSHIPQLHTGRTHTHTRTLTGLFVRGWTMSLRISDRIGTECQLIYGAKPKYSGEIQLNIQPIR
jgi:hypothetical protein